MITRAGLMTNVELVQLDHAADKEHLTESMRPYTSVRPTGFPIT
jgi:hypothetical protein